MPSTPVRRLPVPGLHSAKLACTHETGTAASAGKTAWPTPAAHTPARPAPALLGVTQDPRLAPTLGSNTHGSLRAWSSHDRNQSEWPTADASAGAFAGPAPSAQRYSGFAPVAQRAANVAYAPERPAPAAQRPAGVAYASDSRFGGSLEPKARARPSSFADENEVPPKRQLPQRLRSPLTFDLREESTETPTQSTLRSGGPEVGDGDFLMGLELPSPESNSPDFLAADHLMDDNDSGGDHKDAGTPLRPTQARLPTQVLPQAACTPEGASAAASSSQPPRETDSRTALATCPRWVFHPYRTVPC